MKLPRDPALNYPARSGLHGSAQDRESISERSSSNLNLEIIRDVTRSRENVTISLQNINSVYIRAAPLIIQKCDLALNTHAIFFPNDNDSATSIATGSRGECQWIVRSTFYESEGRPSSCFRCGRGHSLMWAAIKHALIKLHWRLGLCDMTICIGWTK